MGRTEAGKGEEGASQGTSYSTTAEWMINEGLREEGMIGQRDEERQRTGPAKWLSGGRAYRAMEQQVQRPWGKDTYENQRISASLVDLIGLETLAFVLWASGEFVKLNIGTVTLFNPFLST